MLNILKYALVVFVERNCWTNSRGLHEIRLDVEYQLRRAVPFSATIFFDSKDVHFFFFHFSQLKWGKYCYSYKWLCNKKEIVLLHLNVTKGLWVIEWKTAWGVCWRAKTQWKRMSTMLGKPKRRKEKSAIDRWWRSGIKAERSYWQCTWQSSCLHPPPPPQIMNYNSTYVKYAYWNVITSLFCYSARLSTDTLSTNPPFRILQRRLNSRNILSVMTWLHMVLYIVLVCSCPIFVSPFFLYSPWLYAVSSFWCLIFDEQKVRTGKKKMTWRVNTKYERDRNRAFEVILLLDVWDKHVTLAYKQHNFTDSPSLVYCVYTRKVIAFEFLNVDSFVTSNRVRLKLRPSYFPG